jgi:hypothetical protein
VVFSVVVRLSLIMTRLWLVVYYLACKVLSGVVIHVCLAAAGTVDHVRRVEQKWSRVGSRLIRAVALPSFALSPRLTRLCLLWVR